MARWLGAHAWHLQEILFQCSGHWHYFAWLQEFLERSSRQTTGLPLRRVANDMWEGLRAQGNLYLDCEATASKAS